MLNVLEADLGLPLTSAPVARVTRVAAITPLPASANFSLKMSTMHFPFRSVEPVLQIKTLGDI